ncbi:hypothetical protein BwSH20_71870 [Bradyrhizobium ottawaense]|uniref:Uncharacterized protein n=1 Tax=Bradyrhizobium diazoefficiens TaxID=1355477 RepID=A0A809YAA5_9BRAD|nr:hypothetical protein BD122_10930 [Bradyrhizobium diazoefficiens]BAL12936.1 hypothetical protein BJ6T_76910 [Bradyrhizobium japonicum USDA 6]BBO07914.1 hypothetical protein SG09_72640 [Bradyrhizobium ottawaense]GEC50231.1 hypothetical protein BJA01nite_78730 [Bradyrhizobium japonicum]BCA01714.1 hypothetical protein H12S4_26180 [Bradyrhizobium diazoefficiens]
MKELTQADHMFPIHNIFPKEMAIIGRTLLNYGELELDLMNCIQVVRQYDMNSILKAFQDSGREEPHSDRGRSGPRTRADTHAT